MTKGIKIVMDLLGDNQATIAKSSIYPVFAPSNARLPLAVVSSVSETETRNVVINTAGRLITERVSICVFDAKLPNVGVAAKAFYDAIVSYRGTIAGEDVDSIIYAQSSISGYDDDMEAFFYMRDFFIKYRG